MLDFETDFTTEDIENFDFDNFVEEKEPRDPDLVSGLEIMSRAAEALRAKPPMNFPDWANKYFFLPPGSSGLPGQWETAPFQYGLMQFMGSDECQKLVIQKPARVGYTKMVSAMVVYSLAWRKRSMCLWQPIDTDIKEFVQDEIDPLFDYVPVFADALIPDHTRANDPLNTQKRKAFQGAIGHFKPGKSANHYRRMTIDLGILDEVDAFDRNIRGSEGKGEGSPILLSWIRVTDSPYPKQIIGSTPTIKGLSLIESETQSCEMILERFVKCPHKNCGEHQTMKWGTKKSDFGVKWKKGKSKTARYECEHCHELWEWGDINKIDGGGFWGNQDVWFDEQGNDGDGQFYLRESGEPIPFPESIGVMFSTLISPFFSWPQMVREYMSAYKEMKAGDPGKYNVFLNTRMGQTYSESDIEQHDPMKIFARRELYATEVPFGVTAIVCGVDVQGNRIEIDWKGFGLGEECWSLNYVKLIGDTSRVPIYDEEGVRINNDVNTIWDDLHDLVSRGMMHPLYGVMVPVIVCVDSGHETDAVYNFCRLNPTTYIPVKGSSDASPKELVHFSNNARSNKLGVYLVIVDGNQALDVMHARLGLEEPGPGYMHWPKGDQMDTIYTEDHFRQLLAEYRIKVIRNGRPKMTYECPANARNEPGDTWKYCLAAIRLAILSKGVNLTLPTNVIATPDGDVIDKPVPTRQPKAVNFRSKLNSH